MNPNIDHFNGTLRTHRGSITIFWMFHPMAGMMGWMFTDMGEEKATLLQWIVQN